MAKITYILEHKEAAIPDIRKIKYIFVYYILLIKYSYKMILNTAICFVF